MKSKIEKAAVSLLKKGEITQEEFDLIKESAISLKGLIDATKHTFLSPTKSVAFGPSLIGETIAGIAKAVVPKPKGGFEFKKTVPIISEAIPKHVFPWLQGGAYGLFGAALLGQLLRPVVEKIKANQSYNQLIAKNPVLAEKDPKEIKDYFNVIETFSPKAASNPLVAGALINKMMEFGGVDHKLVQDLASIQAGLKQSDTISHLTSAAAKSLLTPGVSETSINLGAG